MRTLFYRITLMKIRGKCAQFLCNDVIMQNILAVLKIGLISFRQNIVYYFFRLSGMSGQVLDKIHVTPQPMMPKQLLLYHVD